MRFITGLLVLSTACAPKMELRSTVGDRPLDVVLVPGCPTEADGTLSPCLQERVAWAITLWEDGVAPAFVVSGAAVHTPYVEAEALAAGLIAAGVPAEVVWTETQARHSDENAGYAAAMAEELGWERIGVASVTMHAQMMQHMLQNWGYDAVFFPLDRERVAARVETLPSVQVPEVAGWHAQAKRQDRPPSWWLYTWRSVTHWVVRYQAPRPERREPTLAPTPMVATRR